MGARIQINSRTIGVDYPTYIVAEISGNHQQNFEQAVKIIEAAKEAGADAVKLQTYTADTLTIDCDNDYFKIQGTIWNGRKLYDLYSEAWTPWEWQPRLRDIAITLGLEFFSTAFDHTHVQVTLHPVESIQRSVHHYDLTPLARQTLRHVKTDFSRSNDYDAHRPSYAATPTMVSAAWLTSL